MIAGLVTADDVIDAVRDTLQTYLPQVLALFDPPLPPPAAYTAPSMEAVRRDVALLPAVVVTSPGLVDEIRRDHEGVYSGTWEVVVGFLVRSAEGDYDSTARDTRRYAAAIRTVLMERADLGGVARDTYGFTEAYAEADPSAARTLGEGAIGCSVDVYDIARIGQTFTGSPAETPTTATTTTVTVDRF